MKNIINMLAEAYQNKVKVGDARDIGKFLQFIAEDYVRYVLTKDFNIGVSGVINDAYGNEPTWDLITKNGVRIQVKYRGGKSSSGRPNLFLETTRRNSQKNAGAKSSSGHVAYGSNEFDIAVFVIPTDKFDYKTTAGLRLLAIPADELVDPEYPNILCRRVSASLMDKYFALTEETLIAYEKKFSKRKH